MAHDEQRWLTPRLQKAAALCNQMPALSGSPLWLGVDALFRKRFAELQVHLPQHSLFMTPLAIASSGREKAEGIYAS